MTTAVTISQDKKEESKENLLKKRDWRKVIKRKFPILVWLPQYTLKNFFQDLLAGFTVALTEIPQSIAYAAIAGLPLQYGLYSSFMGGFAYAIFGSCKAINMGATSLMALLIQSHVTALGIDGSIFMSFIAGIIILAFGLVNLGFIIDFFSYPVMAGFTSAAAVTIASTQLNNFLGIKGKSNEFLEAWKFLFKNIGETSKWNAVLGITSLIVLFFFKEIGIFGKIEKNKNLTKKSLILKRTIFFLSIAKNAIVVILGMVIAYILETKGLNSLVLTGSVDGGLPDFKPPPPFIDNFNSFPKMVKEFGVSLIFIPLVAILESIAIAKVFSKGKTLDASQEMIALGMANIMGSFVQSMPVTGSFSRTAVNNASGAKTNIAAVITGIIILIALQFLTSTFYYIPKATLAAVIICAMFYLFEFHAITTIWKHKKLDMIPFLVTLFSSLFISLEYGILIGIATNLIFVLYSIARPGINIEKVKLSDYHSEIYLITPTATVHFPAGDYLINTISKCEDKTVIIVDGKNMSNMDVTVAKNIAILIENIESKGQKIIFLNFKQSIQDLCTGMCKKLTDRFQMGELENVIIQD